MNVDDLNKKNITELNIELLNLLHEQFNLRIQFARNKQQQTHLFKQLRRQIARIKTLLTKKRGGNEK